jgi:hypothetical protein
LNFPVFGSATRDGGLSTWLFVALFGFVIIGARLLLALVVIYFLTPKQTACIGCDGETLVLTAAHGFTSLGRLLAVERRWCVRCGRTTLTRQVAPPVERAAVVRPRRHVPD